MLSEGGRNLGIGLQGNSLHTCPSDEFGYLVGWVLHVGTGPVNMAIVTANVTGIGPSPFICAHFIGDSEQRLSHFVRVRRFP